ncbi:o-succinylbenzoate--CoA ligase [Bacillus mangrovi]|uniref:2-succinylbenzoate--CoA ligase n=1 Tax=Metabacillus mangrovi TaxID=1491830 RepID=A0A7X2S674_9BACI|nr:o-succinylbenzoate--CoA ligase [Metabacillus mangrovi]
MNDTIPNWLMQRAALTPDRTGLETEHQSFTFRELHSEALKRAGALRKLGIKKGDRIAILLKNSAEMAHQIQAVFYCGATAVLLNTRLTAEEWNYQLKDSKAALFICGEEFDKKIPDANIVTPSQMREMAAPLKDPVEEFVLSDTAVLMYTSGTTGKPKGVMQTFGNHYWSAVGSVLNLGLGPEDKWLAAVPLFHISGLSILIRGIIYGMPVQLHGPFNPEAVNHAILHEKVTIVSVVSTMLAALVENGKGRPYPGSFRCMLLGGGPAPKALLEQCRDQQIPVFQTYGMTETSSQFATLSPEYAISKLGSAGKPLFPCRVRIMNENGEEAPVQTPGEIAVKGPNVMKGYWNREDATAAALRNGWLYTGDIGRVDEEGFLYVLDRRSDLIISGGENVYPAEIEAVLTAHPSIADAGVAAKEDKKWGQVPHAFIVASDPMTESDVIRYCAERLAKYKVPGKVTFMEKLPRNASSKLQRNLLKELDN